MLFTKRERLFAFLAGGFALMAAFLFFQGLRPLPESEKTLLVAKTKRFEEEIQLRNERQKEEVVVVDVKGAVQKPGVYRLPSSARAIDAIEKAGGFIEKADRNRVNLAMRLADGMVVYVPKLGEAPGEWTTTVTKGATNHGKVNINIANAAALEKLPGIGPAKAEAIVRYRQENGRFSSLDDLLNVSGIGESTLAQLKPLITY